MIPIGCGQHMMLNIRLEIRDFFANKKKIVYCMDCGYVLHI